MGESNRVKNGAIAQIQRAMQSLLIHLPSYVALYCRPSRMSQNILQSGTSGSPPDQKHGESNLLSATVHQWQFRVLFEGERELVKSISTSKV